MNDDTLISVFNIVYFTLIIVWKKSADCVVHIFCFFCCKRGGHERMASVEEFGRHMKRATTDLDAASTSMTKMATAEMKKEDEDDDEEEVIEVIEVEDVGPLLSTSITAESQRQAGAAGAAVPMTEEERERKRASKLAKLTGETEEQRLEVVLRRLIYNDETDVGR